MNRNVPNQNSSDIWGTWNIETKGRLKLMVYILSFIAVTFFMFILVAIYSCLVIAGRTDRRYEEMNGNTDSSCKLYQKS